jgi:hypothetical protein
MSRLGRLVAATSLHGPAPLDEVDHNDDDGQNQQNVYKPTQRVACHQSEQQS